MVLLKTDRIILLNYGLPILIVLFSIALATNPIVEKYPELFTAITYDLVLTAPLLFLLISFKSKVSKFKAVPFFIVGIVIATILLPESDQEHLGHIKTYLLPIVEITVLTFLSYKIHKGIKTFRTNSNETNDFLVISKRSALELFGKSRYATLFASEITMMYYAFFCWKRAKPKSNEFTMYKENAGIALAGAFLMVVFVETYAFHVLFIKWSSIAAWVLTGLSIYSAFGIMAHTKALLKRPSVLTNEKLILKNGLIADIYIDLIDISKIGACSKEMNSKELKIGNLGITKESSNHNIAIHFKSPQTIQKMYGFTQECDILLVHIDEKNRFLAEVNKNLSRPTN